MEVVRKGGRWALRHKAVASWEYALSPCSSFEQNYGFLARHAAGSHMFGEATGGMLGRRKCFCVLAHGRAFADAQWLGSADVSKEDTLGICVRACLYSSDDEESAI